MMLEAVILAAAMCGMRDMALQGLEAQYGEQVEAAGLDLQGRMVELVVSADGGTWTLIITQPGGPTCIMAAGEGWRAVPRKPVEPDA